MIFKITYLCPQDESIKTTRVLADSIELINTYARTLSMGRWFKVEELDHVRET